MPGTPRLPQEPPDPVLAPTLAAFGDKPRAALDRLASLAFRAVQLSASQPGMRPRELDRSGRRDLLGRLRSLAIAPAGLDLWIPEAHLRDPARSDRAVAAIQAAVELAADLGRVSLSLLLPRIDDPPDPIEAVLEAVIEKSLRFGVPLADCEVPPSDRDGVRVGIDPVMWLSSGRDPVEAVVAHADRVESARLADLTASGDRIPVGDGEQGRLDLGAYRCALKQCYNATVVVDIRSTHDPWGQLAESVDAWQAAG